jgi:ABC-2 type transport system permease protein
MLRGLWRLAWLEIKIFLREPLGAIGGIGIPVAAFVIMSRVGGPKLASAPGVPRFMTADLPIFAGLLTIASVVLSFVAIIAIYREGGILKRLRATPVRPYTILTAHVVVKLLFTTVTLAALAVAGRRVYPLESGVPIVSFAVALLYCTLCILALGFVIASLVPTARFAQPIGTLILYPMLGLSGLFVPVEALPAGLRELAGVLPLTYAVSLLRGIWHGEGWLAHAGDVAVLGVMFAACLALSTRVFRWE